MRMRPLIFAALLIELLGCTNSTSTVEQMPEMFPTVSDRPRAMTVEPSSYTRPMQTGATATPDANPGEVPADPPVFLRYGECPKDINFPGQIRGAGFINPLGGRIRAEPYPRDYDGGLGALSAQVPAVRADGEDPDPINLEVSIQRVIITATRPRQQPDESMVNPSRGGFWVADGLATMEVYLDSVEVDGPDFEPRVGQVISFRALQVSRYGDKQQITRASDWVLHPPEESPHPQVGANPDAEIYVLEPEEALAANQVHQMIRVTGLIEGVPDTDEGYLECGDARCWMLDYGPGKMTFRSRDEDLRIGSCLTYVGPLSAFQGAPQIDDLTNPDWVRVYQRGGDLGARCEMDVDCTTGSCAYLEGFDPERMCTYNCSDDTACPTRYLCLGTICVPNPGTDVCPEADFFGQLRGDDAAVPNGGEPLQLNELTPHDSGLDVVLAQANLAGDDGVAVDLEVRRVIIAATGALGAGEGASESQSKLWVTDGSVHLELFLARDPASTPPFAIQTGQVVSFRVREVGRYRGKAQVRAVSQWTFEDMPDTNDQTLPYGLNMGVPVLEPTEALDEGTDVGRLVRVSGALEGEPNPCGGGNRCWYLSYGYGQPLILRTQHPDAYTGVCIDYLGPLGLYDGRLQLDTVNLDWLRVYTE